MSPLNEYYFVRCYTSPERKEMDKMKSVLLVDMQKTKLRSHDNYYKSFENKSLKTNQFLSNRIEELTEACNEGLLTDDDKDANRNEEDASQDLVLDDDDEDDIIGQPTTPMFIDFEGL